MFLITGLLIKTGVVIWLSLGEKVVPTAYTFQKYNGRLPPEYPSLTHSEIFQSTQ